MRIAKRVVIVHHQPDTISRRHNEKFQWDDEYAPRVSRCSKFFNFQFNGTPKITTTTTRRRRYEKSNVDDRVEWVENFLLSLGFVFYILFFSAFFLVYDSFPTPPNLLDSLLSLSFVTFTIFTLFHLSVYGFKFDAFVCILTLIRSAYVHRLGRHTLGNFLFCFWRAYVFDMGIFFSFFSSLCVSCILFFLFFCCCCFFSLDGLLFCSF